VVNEAVMKAVRSGSMSSLNAPEEVALAERLVELHPWADMVRYARTGGEAMAIAVRLVRAATGRTTIAFCGYHGWHDWYLAANLSDSDQLAGQLLPGLDPRGVPRNLRETVQPFNFNRIDELEATVSSTGSDLAAIVMEPIRYTRPDKGFLEGVKDIARATGAALVFDEITSGWRHTVGGAHLMLAVDPDVAVFAKAMSNGFPMAAVIGRREIMEVAQESFISSTYWTERIGPAAALASIEQFQKRNIPSILADRGNAIQRAWREECESAGLQKAGLRMKIDGLPALSHFSLGHPDEVALTTLLTQELLKRGIMGNAAFYASAGHTEEAVSRYRMALSEVLPIIRDAAASGHIEDALNGPIRHTGFARLT
jgi:glutamate-1-semialdehyde aminotransferase